MGSPDPAAGSGSTPEQAAALVAEAVLARPPRLGSARLVCVDGPAGSGKSTLADAVARRTDATVVRMDDLYAGWSGLDAAAGQLDTLLLPLAEGRPGHYRRYDWDTGRFAETVTVPPAPVLVLDGVGSGSRRHAGLRSLLVWVEAPRRLRLARGLERDGPRLRQQWLDWMRVEQAHFEQEGTRTAADVLVDGTGHRLPIVRNADTAVNP